MSAVAAFSAICQEDAYWIPQYLAEAERLNLPFAIHLDRCKMTGDFADENLLRRLARHPLCIGSTVQFLSKVEFNETHKQGILDLVQSQGFDWALAWDIDETYEQDFWKKLAWLEHRAEDCFDTQWLNLWESRDKIRVDSGFLEGHRVKLYNLKGDRRWRFDHPITNGPKLIKDRETILAKLDLVCLHHGMMTHAFRVLHKERWDRIYSTALRGDPNPYNFWNHALDPSITPVVVKHNYREDYL